MCGPRSAGQHRVTRSPCPPARPRSRPSRHTARPLMCLCAIMKQAPPYPTRWGGRAIAISPPPRIFSQFAMLRIMQRPRERRPPPPYPPSKLGGVVDWNGPVFTSTTTSSHIGGTLAEHHPPCSAHLCRRAVHISGRSSIHRRHLGGRCAKNALAYLRPI